MATRERVNIHPAAANSIPLFLMTEWMSRVTSIKEKDDHPLFSPHGKMWRKFPLLPELSGKNIGEM